MNSDNSTQRAAERVASLPLWRGDATPEPVSGGITNVNFSVDDGDQRYFVRLGEDIPVHGVLRWHELATSRAAHAAGVGPEVVYHERGVLVLRWVDGATLDEQALHDESRLVRVVDAVRTLHERAPRTIRGPVLTFWVFQVVSGYAAQLRDDASRHAPILARLLDVAASLERDVGAIDLRFGHNDLLPANLIDDGERITIVDYEYGGFNSPLFDLGGLASNAQLPPELERLALRHYFGGDGDYTRARSYSAMKCASLLRETLWSMVSERHSTLDFDYAAYTAENLERFERALATHRAQFDD